MNLEKHLDRAEQALERGQPDFAIELCDQVLDFAPGDARAAELLVRAALEGGAAGVLGKLGAKGGGLLSKVARLARNPEAEARNLRRAFLRNPGDAALGVQWADALERAGHEGGALGVCRALAEVDAEAAKRAGRLAAARGRVDEALAFYEKALAVDPRDTEAMRARKNLAAEQALRSGGSEGSGLDTEAFLRAARGEDGPPPSA